MAEGFEMGEFGMTDDDWACTADDTSFIATDSNESASILTREYALAHYTGESVRKELLETKVDAFLKVVADNCGLLPTKTIYDELVLREDGRSLYLKENNNALHGRKTPQSTEFWHLSARPTLYALDYFLNTK